MSEPVVYCIDSSALIDLRQLYPRRIFPGVWEKLTELVRAGRLIAPREVLKETEKDEELPSWYKSNKRMFVGLDEEQGQIVSEILKKFPALTDQTKETPDADPFIIALAISRNRKAKKSLFGPNHVVLTRERAGTGGRPRIPDVCRYCAVDCMAGPAALTDMFQKEGWTFG